MTLLQASNVKVNAAELHVTCRNVDGTTELIEKYSKAPLKISKTFRDEDSGRLCLYMVDVSPGMLDGDTYALDFKLMANAHLVLTNQSFTKIHPTPFTGANLHARFHLEQDAILEYFPEPTIPYYDSRFQATNRFDLSAGSTLFFADVVTPGRTHRDERFDFDCYENQVEVYRNEKLVVWDHFRLEPKLNRHDSMGAMEQFTHCGSMWILTDQPTEGLLNKIRAILAELDPKSFLAGASLTADKDISVRMLGHNVWQLQHLIQEIWDVCRNEILHLPPCHLRK